MSGRPASEEARTQAAIDAEFLIQKSGTQKKAASLAGVSSSTVHRALKIDPSLTPRATIKLREAAERMERGVLVSTSPNGKDATGDVFSHCREALRHFDKGLHCLEVAADHAMPISRPGFKHVEGEIRKILDTYLNPMLK